MQAGFDRRRAKVRQVSSCYGIHLIQGGRESGIYPLGIAIESPCWRNRMDRFGLRLGAIKSWMWCLGIGMALVTPMAVPRSLAQSREDIDERCQRRVEHAEHELHEAIERHGRSSRQADHERRELQEARERCWREHHRWWNEHERRWHDQRDWDDRDHDHD